MQLKPQQWDTQALEARLQGLWVRFSEPHMLTRLQRMLLGLLVFWAVVSLVRLVWSLLPAPLVQVPTAAPVNPIVVTGGAQRTVTVDLDAMLGLELFGEPEAVVDASLLDQNAGGNSRDGIESGARETRLDLKLQGILASSDDGLGKVVIEASGKQQHYAVGDKLPAAGRVSLAKVMPRQVVLDNNGTYELLSLFEDDELSRTIPKSASVPEPQSAQSGPKVNTRNVRTLNNRRLEQQASQYRAQLYDNPQLLADLVTVAAVRDDNGLRGYRVGPGKDPNQFAAFGFEAGDLVIAINGYSLSDPANTVRLYQLMRDATQATFDIERDGVAVSLSVSLNEL